jgi:hypothetical protein
MKEEKLGAESPEWKAKRHDWIRFLTEPTSNETAIHSVDCTDYARLVRYSAWVQLTSDSKKKLQNLHIVQAGYGFCLECSPNTTRKLYKSNLTGDNIQCWKHLTFQIVDTELRWDIYSWTPEEQMQFTQFGLGDSVGPMNGGRMQDMLFDPSSLIAPAHEERGTCVSCRDWLLIGDDVPPEWQSVNAFNGSYDADGVQQTYAVHVRCGYKCAYDECTFVYTRSHQLTRIDGVLYCHAHRDAIIESTGAVCCDWCSYYYTTDLEYSELRDADLCTDCYHSEWDCNDCGYSRHGEDSHSCEDDDDDDWGSNRSDYINNYSYKPTPEFFGSPSTVFLGMELEVEPKDSIDFEDKEETARTVAESNGRRFYLKEDGSLDNGFEIVTHPHSLEAFQKEIDWSFLNYLRKQGWVSWNSGSCGLHVHIGLKAFVNMAHEARFTKFIYDNKRQVQRIAGRESGYASFSDKGNAVGKIKYKNEKSWDRYQAVNNLNRNTLEVRVFKGSLRYERVLSAIEFVHAVCEYTRSLSLVAKDKPFGWAKFTGFVAVNADTYPNLFIIMNESFERVQEKEDIEMGASV